MIQGDSEYFYVNIIPTGAIPYADISVSVENEKIAESEYDDADDSVCITANRIGKTTITLTGANGVNCEYTIIVLPKIIGFFRDVVSLIEMFFLGIIESFLGLFDID